MRYKRRRMVSQAGCKLEILVDPQSSPYDLEACLALVSTAGWESGCGVLFSDDDGGLVLLLARTSPPGRTLPWIRVSTQQVGRTDPRGRGLKARVKIALDPTGVARVAATFCWENWPRQQPLVMLVPPEVQASVGLSSVADVIREMRVGHLLVLFPSSDRGAAEVRFERSLDLASGAVLLQAKEGWIPLMIAPEVVDTAELVLERTALDVITNAFVKPDGSLQVRGLDSFVMAVRSRSFTGLHAIAEKGRVVVHARQERVRSIDFAKEIDGMLRHFRNLFSELDRLHIVECPTAEALALSFPHLIVLDPKLLASPATALFRFLPHEIAHQWIGNKVTFDGAGHIWLLEGLSEFLQLQYIKERLGEQMYRRGLIYSASVYARRTRQGDMAIMDWTPDASDHLFDALVAKGTVAWHYLATELGEAAFRSLLKGLLGLSTPVKVSDVMALAEQISGRNLGAFWQDWLTQSGWLAHADIVPDQRAQERPSEEETMHGTSGLGGRGSL